MTLLQNYWQSYFIPRVLYYWSKRYIEDFKEKSQYDFLKPCISINILNERFKYSNSIHSVYELLERKEHSNLENYLELHFLDLTKVKDENMSLLEKWLLFIKTDDREVPTPNDFDIRFDDLFDETFKFQDISSDLFYLEKI